MTELEKMLAGKIYNAADPALAVFRRTAHRLCKAYNDTPEDEEDKRAAILDELLPGHGRGAYLQGPVFFDYGFNTRVGLAFYANYNFTVLDTCPVTIGDNVMIGPNCSLVTPVHPMRWQERNFFTAADGSIAEHEYARPIQIGDNCWLASNVTVTGGVRIGNGCVIGAGSVVTRDIPDNTFAAGNPCRVIRAITEQDAVSLKKELW